MNLVLDYSQFNVRNIHFLDTKKNIIIDGIFTKIVYLDEMVSLNAIYIMFPCKYCIDRCNHMRNHILFSLDTPENHDMIQLELDILNAYMKHYQINKRKNTNLAVQILNGRTRLYREGIHDTNNPMSESPDIVLKISGVWETEQEIGITYKFVEMMKPTRQ